MRRWYTVKVQYTKNINNDGEDDTKRVTEAFLLSAVSFTDAEAIITKEIGQLAQGEFLVKAMSITDITKVFGSDTNEPAWYMCKTVSMYDDEGKVTTEKENFMIAAESVNDATLKLEDKLEYMDNFEITNVALSPIVDIFRGEVVSKIEVVVD